MRTQSVQTCLVGLSANADKALMATASLAAILMSARLDFAANSLNVEIMLAPTNATVSTGFPFQMMSRAVMMSMNAAVTKDHVEKIKSVKMQLERFSASVKLDTSLPASIAVLTLMNAQGRTNAMNTRFA